MFILFGFGHKTVKEFGGQGEILCRRCNNTREWSYKKITSWFTLFFIPIIPYSTNYVRVCPICGEHDKLSKETFLAIVEGGEPGETVDVDSHYEGMTETQANYMREMNAIKVEKNQGDTE